MSDSLRPHKLHSPWNSLGQNTGVGSLSLLQGIFLTQGSNPGLPHCRRILYQLSHTNNFKVSEKSAAVKHGSDPLLFLVWFFFLHSFLFSTFFFASSFHLTEDFSILLVFLQKSFLWAAFIVLHKWVGPTEGELHPWVWYPCVAAPLPL